MPNRISSLLLLAGALVCLGASLGACKNSNVASDGATADRYVPASNGGSMGGDSASGGRSTGGQSGGGGADQGSGGGKGSGGAPGKGGASGADASIGKDAIQGKDASVETPPAIDGGPVACDDITSPGRLAVYYYSDSAASGSSIQIHLDLVNYTAFSSKLTQVTVRYWFTDEARAIDAGSLANVLEQYYVPVATTMKFVTLDPPRSGADTVLEMSYSSAPDAGTSWVETRGFNFAFHKTSYDGTYDQTNDYSYDATLKSALGLNPKITAYVDGVLAWGCEPPPQ